MKYVNLGSTGMRVSRVCLGMMSFGNDSDRPWVLDESAAEPIVRAAADGGITFFDTADTYSAGASEVATGRLLSKFFSREEMVVATKVFNPVGRMAPGGGGSTVPSSTTIRVRSRGRPAATEVTREENCLWNTSATRSASSNR